MVVTKLNIVGITVNEPKADAPLIDFAAQYRHRGHQRIFLFFPNRHHSDPVPTLNKRAWARHRHIGRDGEMPPYGLL